MHRSPGKPFFKLNEILKNNRSEIFLDQKFTTIIVRDDY